LTVDEAPDARGEKRRIPGEQCGIADESYPMQGVQPAGCYWQLSLSL